MPDFQFPFSIFWHVIYGVRSDLARREQVFSTLNPPVEVRPVSEDLFRVDGGCRY